MLNNTNNSIKASAKLAKKRLVTGYWNNIRQERDDYICKNKGNDIKKMQQAYTRKLERDLQDENNPDNDALLYKKVCKLLTQENFVLNPISQLIDHNEYDKLSDSAKQVYLLKLSAKYNELQNKFYEESQHKGTLKQAQV